MLSRDHFGMLGVLSLGLVVALVLKPTTACLGVGSAPTSSLAGGGGGQPDCGIECRTKKCFHPATVFAVAEGESVPVSSLLAGDRVLGSVAPYSQQLQPVRVPSVQRVDGVRTFVKIITATNKQLTVTEEHLVYVRAACMTRDAWNSLPASYVELNNCVLVQDPNDASVLIEDHVTSLEQVSADHVYELKSASGNVVANGVFTSTEDFGQLNVDLFLGIQPRGDALGYGEDSEDGEAGQGQTDKPDDLKDLPKHKSSSVEAEQ